MRRYVTELIGTFFLVFTIGVVSLGRSPIAPIAIGAVLMTMVYAGGHISGAHYNPAVTLAVLVRRRITGLEAGIYVVAQAVGAGLAAWLASYVVNPKDVQTVTFGTGREMGSAFTGELLFTFALAYVVLNVAFSRDHPDNSFYGLAIGFTVLAGALALGGVSGAAFNPAVALGASLMGLFSWGAIWMYLVANFVGGAAAGLAFLVVNPEDR